MYRTVGRLSIWHVIVTLVRSQGAHVLRNAKSSSGSASPVPEHANQAAQRSAALATVGPEQQGVGVGVGVVVLQHQVLII